MEQEYKYVKLLLTCIFHKADSDTASYPCRTSGKCHSNTLRTAYDTPHMSAVPKTAIPYIYAVLFSCMKSNTTVTSHWSMSGPLTAGSGGRAPAVFLTYMLHCLTLGALHLSDFESVHLVVLLCIMAQSAHIQFTTARCLQYTEMCEWDMATTATLCELNWGKLNLQQPLFYESWSWYVHMWN